MTDSTKLTLSTNPADYSDDPADLLLPVEWESENICENPELQAAWTTNPYEVRVLN